MARRSAKVLLAATVLLPASAGVADTAPASAAVMPMTSIVRA